MSNGLRVLQDVYTELVNGEILCDLGCADGLLCLLKFEEHAQRASDRLARNVAPCGMCFTPSKYDVLLQAWTSVAPN